MILFAFLHRLFGLASAGVLGLAAWLIWTWYDRKESLEGVGLEASDERLYWGLGLLAWSFLGRFVILLILGRSGPGADAGKGEGVDIPAPDGARLSLETRGVDQGPIVLLVHGWGMSQRIWGQARRALEPRFGVTSFDLPGAGRSSRPVGWSIEAFAEDLHAVIESLPEDRKIVVVGHSIGGMTAQTFCARHPDVAERRLSGLVLENTTHRDPLTTMILSSLLTRLKPLIKLVLHIDTVVSPLLWVMNWQSYLSGSTHLAMRIAGFGDRPTWATLDLSALLPTLTSPSVQAHGNLAMLDWSVTERLPRITVPTLVFVGGRDIVTKDHAGETILTRLPNARLVRVETAGHMGPFERPDDYNAEIAAFIDEVSARA